MGFRSKDVGCLLIWIPAPNSYQFNGVVNEVAVLIEKKCADKISRDTGNRIKLTAHPKRTPIA